MPANNYKPETRQIIHLAYDYVRANPGRDYGGATTDNEKMLHMFKNKWNKPGKFVEYFPTILPFYGEDSRQKDNFLKKFKRAIAIAEAVADGACLPPRPSQQELDDSLVLMRAPRTPAKKTPRKSNNPPPQPRKTRRAVSPDPQASGRDVAAPPVPAAAPTQLELIMTTLAANVSTLTTQQTRFNTNVEAKFAEQDGINAQQNEINAQQDEINADNEEFKRKQQKHNNFLRKKCSMYDETLDVYDETFSAIDERFSALEAIVKKSKDFPEHQD